MSSQAGGGQPTLFTGRLIRAATALGRVVSKVHKDTHGLTTPEFYVLALLGNVEDGTLTSSIIVEQTAMDKTKVSRAVSALARRGWLARTRATTDRRFEYLALKPEGRRIFALLMPRVAEAEGDVLKSLSEAERVDLEHGLAGLERAFRH